MPTRHAPAPAQPGPPQRKRNWLWRGLLIAFLILAALPLIGLIYQSTATAIDQSRFPPPGQLVDVGSRRLHINCQGQGSPTILLEHASGSSSLQWALVQPLLAEHARVCAYDRAGFGWSDSNPDPAGLQQTADDLDALLAAAGESPPYLLVGHSYGARVARLFAANHPTTVGGLVLLDPAIDYSDGRYPAELHTQRAEEGDMLSMAAAIAPFGAVRLLQPIMNSGPLGDLPPTVQSAIRSFEASTRFWQSIGADAQTGNGSNGDYQVTTLGDLPLLVLSASQPDDAVRRAWSAANADLALLSSQGRHRQIDDTAHMTLVYDQSGADTVAAAILDLLPAVTAAQGAP